MDAFELLKKDHKKVAQLFDRLEAASGNSKLKVFSEIKSELELHAHVEETIFYPAIEKPEETHDLTLEAYEEHKVVKTLLEELSGAKSADDEWQAKAKVLRENVEHHVDEEENELFDKADNVLSDEEIEKLGSRMEAEKARKQGRPAPRKPAAQQDQPGILDKVANLIGLGSKTKKKSGSKKTATKSRAKVRKASGSTANKRAAAKRPSTKTAAKKSTGSAKGKRVAKAAKKR